MSGRRDRSPPDWDDLIDLLRRVPDADGITLVQAQQLFAAAPDNPLTSGQIRNMVAVAINRQDKTLEKSWGELLAGLLLTADLTGGLQLASCSSSDLVGLHGWNRLLAADEVDTYSVDSLSVDVNLLHIPPLSREMRLSRLNADPVILDVWVGVTEPGNQPMRNLRDGTARWHVGLEADEWELGHCVSQSAVSCPPWLESAGYDDEAREEIRRN